MKTLNKKKGSIYVEIILAILVMSMLTMVIFNSSKLLVLSDQTKKFAEINMVSKSYINKAKINCENNGEVEVQENVTIYGTIDLTMTYSCTLIKDKLFLINLSILNNGKEKLYESYYFKP